MIVLLGVVSPHCLVSVWFERNAARDLKLLRVDQVILVGRVSPTPTSDPGYVHLLKSRDVDYLRSIRR